MRFKKIIEFKKNVSRSESSKQIIRVFKYKEDVSFDKVFSFFQEHLEKYFDVLKFLEVKVNKEFVPVSKDGYSAFNIKYKNKENSLGLETGFENEVLVCYTGEEKHVSISKKFVGYMNKNRTNSYDFFEKKLIEFLKPYCLEDWSSNFISINGYHNIY